jgi:hypothetical protein
VVTLLECLTLERPFSGATRDQLFHNILVGDWISARKLNPRIPRELGTVIEKAIELAPAARYATAEAFADDLRSIRAFEPIAARAPGPILRLRRWARRRPWKAASAAAALLLVLGASGFLVQQRIARVLEVDARIEEAEARLGSRDFAAALESVAQATPSTRARRASASSRPASSGSRTSHGARRGAPPTWPRRRRHATSPRVCRPTTRACAA